jgi:hypothetical protein
MSPTLSFDEKRDYEARRQHRKNRHLSCSSQTSTTSSAPSIIISSSTTSLSLSEHSHPEAGRHVRFLEPKHHSDIPAHYTNNGELRPQTLKRQRSSSSGQEGEWAWWAQSCYRYSDAQMSLPPGGQHTNMSHAAIDVRISLEGSSTREDVRHV